MTREEYLHHRNSNNMGQVLFQEYVSYCEEKKQPIFNISEFIQFLKIWQFRSNGVDTILSDFIKKKDIEFEVIVLSKKDGQIIKYL